MDKSVNANKTDAAQAAALTFAQVTVQTLDAVSKRREVWESTDFKKASDGLYELLADCYSIYEEKFINADEAGQKMVRLELKARLQAAGVKVQLNTTTLTMIVRFVFGSDRKRAHGYTYVLKAAHSHEVLAADLATWIKSNGGIEEIKRKNVISKDALDKREKRVAALEEVKAAAETAAIVPFGEVKLEASISLGENAVLVVQPNADGTANVIAVLPEADKAVVEAIFKRIARDAVKAASENEARAKEAAVNKPLEKQVEEVAELQALAA
jgi:hypothetical protein